MRRLGFAVLLLLPGCKDERPEVVRKVIGRDGGQVTSHDDVLTLLFLPGSLPGDTEIVIFPSDTPPLVFGPAYRVQPDIDVEVPIDITYQHELPADPIGTAIVAVHREAFEAGHGNWEVLPVTELDPENQLVAGIDAEISLFYGLMEDAFVDPTTSTTESSSTTEDPTMTETDTGDPDTGETETIPLSFAEDVEPILLANCTGMLCHGVGANSPTMAENAYDNLVNRPSVVAAADLIVPGDSMASYLMHKLDNTHNLDAALGGCGCNGSGFSMPQGLPLLPVETRDTIREWINDGAEP